MEEKPDIKKQTSFYKRIGWLLIFIGILVILIPTLLAYNYYNHNGGDSTMVGIILIVYGLIGISIISIGISFMRQSVIGLIISTILFVIIMGLVGSG